MGTGLGREAERRISALCQHCSSHETQACTTKPSLTHYSTHETQACTQYSTHETLACTTKPSLHPLLSSRNPSLHTLLNSRNPSLHPLLNLRNPSLHPLLNSQNPSLHPLLNSQNQACTHHSTHETKPAPQNQACTQSSTEVNVRIDARTHTASNHKIHMALVYCKHPHPGSHPHTHTRTHTRTHTLTQPHSQPSRMAQNHYLELNTLSDLFSIAPMLKSSTATMLNRFKSYSRPKVCVHAGVCVFK